MSALRDKALLREAVKNAVYVWLYLYVWKVPSNWIKVGAG